MFSYKLLKVALIHILPEPAEKAELQKWYIGSEESKKRMKQNTGEWSEAVRSYD